MATGFCPQCGQPRTGERFCGKCGNDFWRAAAGTAPSTEPTISPAPTPAAKSGPSAFARIIGGLVFLGLAFLVIYVITRLFAGGVTTANGPAAVNVPPEGSIWFGSTFDPSTFEISGRTTTVSSTGTFAMVGHTTRSLDSSEIVLRVYWNGTLVTNQQPNAKGSGDVWGFSPGPLFEAGEWKFEIVDIGGNVLASGTVTAT